MSAPLDMAEEFRALLQFARAVGIQKTEVTDSDLTALLLVVGRYSVPQVRAVACQLATTSPEEALAILDGVRKFEVEG